MLQEKILEIFHPDLIVEATKVCDLACKGCYAINTLAKRNLSQSDYNKNRGWYLNPESLKKAINQLKLQNQIIGIRGGEPTHHPELAKILELLKPNENSIFVETHGKWLLDKKHTKQIAESIQQKAIVKVSIDSMHGFSPKNTYKMLDNLEELNLKYCIAITENNIENTLATYSKVADRLTRSTKVFHQQLITNWKDLYSPRLGIIGISGIIRNKLRN